jgi:16S rRNA (cytosine1402-N4)-methyltransferase
LAEASHEPVLVGEVVRLLRDADVVLDLTVGSGGHAAALLEAGVGRVIGLDRDPDAVSAARERLAGYGERFRAQRGRFSDVAGVAEQAGVREAGVLYDLGVSSMQLDTAGRGFSYRREGPLDMRMGAEGPTAADVVNDYTEEELVRVLRERGEERFARRIARSIVRARERAPLRTTSDLVRVVAGAVPKRRGGPHPARRTFQAIRLEVNRELEELAASLPRAADVLAPGGRVLAITYHSLEDRIVKRFVNDRGDLDALTKKPLRPSRSEQQRNPRSRAAKLRAAEKLPAKNDEAA